MRLGYGVRVKELKGKAYVDAWHYEDRGGRRGQVFEYVGPRGDPAPGGRGEGQAGRGPGGRGGGAGPGFRVGGPAGRSRHGGAGEGPDGPVPGEGVGGVPEAGAEGLGRGHPAVVEIGRAAWRERGEN